MNREQLVQIRKRIISCDGTEGEIDRLIEIFDENGPHPNGANLFFYPENYDARNDDRTKYNPTVEEVVDKALSYTPIILPRLKTKG